jgi:hypothetical protein
MNNIFNIILLILITGILLLIINNNSIARFLVTYEKELVIARYAEDISWVNNGNTGDNNFYFSDYFITCYNKGKTIANCNNCNIIKLQNLGRESHTYIYHIVKNYNNLANVTVFTMGSCMDPHKIEKFKTVIEVVNSTNNTILVGNRMTNIKDQFYDFELNDWCGTNNTNATELGKCNMIESKIKPFGKWYESKFGNLVTTLVNYLERFQSSLHRLK